MWIELASVLCIGALFGGIASFIILFILDKLYGAWLFKRSLKKRRKEIDKND